MNEFIKQTQQTPDNNPWLPERQNDHEQYEANHELLIGESRTLAKCYELATKLDSRLENVAIVPEQLDENRKRPAFATKPWRTASGMAEVHVLFGDRDAINQVAWETVRADPEFKEYIRKLLGEPKGEPVNKKIISGVILLHELGHVADYFDNNDNREEYDRRMRAEKDSLPLGYLSDKSIIEKYDSGDTQFQQKVIQEFGSLENALSKYRTLRHQLPFEQKADGFVSKVIMNDTTGWAGLFNEEIYKD